MNIQGWTHPESCQCRLCYAGRQEARNKQARMRDVPDVPELHPEMARRVLKRMPLRERLGRWILRRLGLGF